MTMPFFAGQKATAGQLNGVLPVGQSVTTLLTVNSTSSPGLSIPGLAWPVLAGGMYQLTGSLFGTQGATTAQQAIGIAGPAASMVAVGYDSVAEGSAANIEFGASELTAMNTRGSLFLLSAGLLPANDPFITRFAGTLTFTASGTLTLCASCVTSAADTWNVRPGSFGVLLPV